MAVQKLFNGKSMSDNVYVAIVAHYDCHIVRSTNVLYNNFHVFYFTKFANIDKATKLNDSKNK